MVTILIVEDEEIIAQGVQLFLSNAGYHVDIAGTLKKATDLLNQTVYDLLLLDMMLPDGDGLSFARELDTSAKIIFLTALDDEQRIVDSFAIGSEDYITKPFRLPVLLARVQAVIKRNALDQPTHLKRFGSMVIDTALETIEIQGKAVLLSKTEHRLFFYLFKHLDQLLSREQLLAYMWDNHGEFVNDNTLSVTLKRLRQKIISEHLIIETRRGMGYCLKEVKDETVSSS